MTGQLNKFRRLFLAGAVAAGNFLSLPAWAETRLVMVEEIGCMWCAQWNRVIAPIYPKTPEGQAAPLLRIDIHDDAPEGMSFISALRFTPTFILVQDGQEVRRIEGYPGEDFFWGLLQVMLNDAGIEYNEKAES